MTNMRCVRNTLFVYTDAYVKITSSLVKKKEKEKKDKSPGGAHSLGYRLFCVDCRE